MLEFCQDQASPAINAIAKNIERSRQSEEGLDLASFAVPPIGGDLTNGNASFICCVGVSARASVYNIAALY